MGRDCFVAQGAPRNDMANLVEIYFSIPVQNSQYASQRRTTAVPAVVPAILPNTEPETRPVPPG
jgi:hypothetical protein